MVKILVVIAVFVAGMIVWANYSSNIKAKAKNTVDSVKTGTADTLRHTADDIETSK